MATSSRPAWVAKISSLNFIPLSLIADKHLARTFSKIMNLPVTGNFRPILTSICRFSASYKASYSFLKSSVLFSIRADSFFDAFVFFITSIFDGQTLIELSPLLLIGGNWQQLSRAGYSLRGFPHDAKRWRATRLNL